MVETASIATKKPFVPWLQAPYSNVMYPLLSGICVDERLTIKTRDSTADSSNMSSIIYYYSDIKVQSLTRDTVLLLKTFLLPFQLIWLSLSSISS